MPDDTPDQLPSQASLPPPAFHFEVTIGEPNGLKGVFAEVTGLNADTLVIEYRSNNLLPRTSIQMPGISKVGNVTLKRGLFSGDNSFWDFYGSIQQNTIKRQTVIIILLDEKKAAAMQWTLTNAWPTKLTGADLKSDGSEVAVHTIELAYESLKVTGA